ncbi:hypothetical protein MM236_06935 [Belliella sp. DSM 107340]|uniref:DUF3450 domain-containing protein n=1 Tax=Belliella calami TaxID=2923436 RepID=A0ABS9UM79_9BACT|nr:hypothetical protein [Belliella calami]MCH7397716.1 hypothetical protein [Belliella calami]
MLLKFNLIILIISVVGTTSLTAQNFEEEKIKNKKLEEQLEKKNQEIYSLERTVESQGLEIEKQIGEIENLNLEIRELEKQVKYIREVLDLYNVSNTFIEEEFEFKITSVIGNRNSGKILIKGLVTNKGQAHKLQLKAAELIDLKGNVYKSSNFSFSEYGMMIPNLPKDIPVNFSIHFSGVDEDGLSTIKLFSPVIFSRQYSRSIPILFKNLDIQWD